jgi:serralysin
MQRSFLGLLLLLLVSHAAPSQTAYFLSPTGNDSASGLTLSTPWLTPNHPLNCGDTITAAAGSYSASNFNTGAWGTVSCPANNNVAWLLCATFDACKISTTTGAGMWIDRNYWGVQGFEATSSASFGPCFLVAPRYSAPAQVHHVILANNIANGCTQGGFITNTFGGLGADYVVFLGNIAYNAARGAAACTSGISVYEPSNSDTLPGTHIYVAGNFAWANVDPNPCNGTIPTDGEGVILDTFSQWSYSGQAVVDNNLVFSNGGQGVSVTHNHFAPVVFRHNTAAQDLTNINPYSGELGLYDTVQTQAYSNLFDATATRSNLFTMATGQSGPSNQVNNNFAYSADGATLFTDGFNGIAFGSVTLGINPAFTHPINPGAPSCGKSKNTVACMAAVIAGYTATASAANGSGYHTPSPTPIADPLYPQWLCSTKLPAGLVTSGCGM